MHRTTSLRANPAGLGCGSRPFAEPPSLLPRRTHGTLTGITAARRSPATAGQPSESSEPPARSRRGRSRTDSTSPSKRGSKRNGARPKHSTDEALSTHSSDNSPGSSPQHPQHGDALLSHSSSLVVKGKAEALQVAESLAEQHTQQLQQAVPEGSTAAVSLDSLDLDKGPDVLEPLLHRDPTPQEPDHHLHHTPGSVPSAVSSAIALGATLHTHTPSTAAPDPAPQPPTPCATDTPSSTAGRAPEQQPEPVRSLSPEAAPEQGTQYSTLGSSIRPAAQQQHAEGHDCTPEHTPSDSFYLNDDWGRSMQVEPPAPGSMHHIVLPTITGDTAPSGPQPGTEPAKISSLPEPDPGFEEVEREHERRQQEGAGGGDRVTESGVIVPGDFVTDSWAAPTPLPQPQPSSAPRPGSTNADTAAARDTGDTPQVAAGVGDLPRGALVVPSNARSQAVLREMQADLSPEGMTHSDWLSLRSGEDLTDPSHSAAAAWPYDTQQPQLQRPPQPDTPQASAGPQPQATGSVPHSAVDGEARKPEVIEEQAHGSPTDTQGTVLSSVAEVPDEEGGEDLDQLLVMQQTTTQPPGSASHLSSLEEEAAIQNIMEMIEHPEQVLEGLRQQPWGDHTSAPYFMAVVEAAREADEELHPGQGHHTLASDAAAHTKPAGAGQLLQLTSTPSSTEDPFVHGLGGGKGTLEEQYVQSRSEDLKRFTQETGMNSESFMTELNKASPANHNLTPPADTAQTPAPTPQPQNTAGQDGPKQQLAATTANPSVGEPSQPVAAAATPAAAPAAEAGHSQQRAAAAVDTDPVSAARRTNLESVSSEIRHMRAEVREALKLIKDVRSAVTSGLAPVVVDNAALLLHDKGTSDPGTGVLDQAVGGAPAYDSLGLPGDSDNSITHAQLSGGGGSSGGRSGDSGARGGEGLRGAGGGDRASGTDAIADSGGAAPPGGHMEFTGGGDGEGGTGRSTVSNRLLFVLVAGIALAVFLWHAAGNVQPRALSRPGTAHHSYAGSILKGESRHHGHRGTDGDADAQDTEWHAQGFMEEGPREAEEYLDDGGASSYKGQAAESEAGGVASTRQ